MTKNGGRNWARDSISLFKNEIIQLKKVYDSGIRQYGEI